MYPRSKIHHQQGSMLVIALFVIVVMAALGLTMTRILSASSDSVVYEVYGLRALNAARSGIEAKVSEVFPLSGAPDCATSLNSNADFSAVGGFENCTYTASCEATALGAGGINGTLYRFTSVGNCSIGDITISRQIQVEARE